jgi:ABC-2 type transport system permease protein
MNLLASVRKELFEQWRTYRLLILVIVMAVWAMLSPLGAKYMSQIITGLAGDQFANLVPAESTIMDAIAQYVKNMPMWGILLALLLSMGSVAAEKEKGTAALMLVKPLSRASFLAAKFLALGLAFLASIVVAALISYLYTLILFGPLALGPWVALNGLLWLEMLLTGALTLMLSTLLRSQAAAAGLCLFGIMLVNLIGGFPGGLGRAMPPQLTAWGASLFTPQPVAYWPAFFVSLGLILACLLVAWIVFERQEL